MIDDQTKKNLLAELAKSGNVYFACAKTNVSRATYYRWRNEDKQFRRASDKALRHGRNNMVDIAEQALMQKVKEKDLGAIKYTLAHNSKRYRPIKDAKQEMGRTGPNPVDQYFDRLDQMYDADEATKKDSAT